MVEEVFARTHKILVEGARRRWLVLRGRLLGVDVRIEALSHVDQRLVNPAALVNLVLECLFLDLLGPHRQCAAPRVHSAVHRTSDFAVHALETCPVGTDWWDFAGVFDMGVVVLLACDAQEACIHTATFLTFGSERVLSFVSSCRGRLPTRLLGVRTLFLGGDPYVVIFVLLPLNILNVFNFLFKVVLVEKLAVREGLGPNNLP